MKELQSKLLTFLNEDKTKVLVASGIDTLDQAAQSSGFSRSMTKIVFDVRPIKMNEQIDQKILSDKAWMEEAKNINIFVVPNVPSEKLEKYISLAKDFLQKNNVEIKDSYVDKFSSSGVLSVKINFPTTSKLLQSSSFVFRVHETPKLEAQEVREGEASHVISESKSAIRGSVTIGESSQSCC